MKTDQTNSCWMNTEVHIAVFTIAKRLKQCKSPSTDKQINKLRQISAAEYYPAIKRNEVPVHVISQMNRGNIMLSKRSQAQKATCCMVLFIWNIQDRQIHRNSSFVVTRDCGMRIRKWLTNGYRVSIWGGFVWRTLCNDDCTMEQTCLMPLNCTHSDV